MTALTSLVNAGEPKGPQDGADWQLWVYSSAAPALPGSNANVLALDGSVLREGSNDWTRVIGNPRPAPKSGWASAHDAMPICTDQVGKKWMSDFMTGKDPSIERDAWLLMLHGEVGEDNTTAGVLNKADAADPSQWIESGPHLMMLPRDPPSLPETRLLSQRPVFLPRDLSSLDGMDDDFNRDGPYVMFPGTQGAHVMIPVRGYYDYPAPK